MITNLGALKQQKFILAQFWKREAQNQGVSLRALFAALEGPSWPIPSFSCCWRALALLGL